MLSGTVYPGNIHRNKIEKQQLRNRGPRGHSYLLLIAVCDTSIASTMDFIWPHAGNTLRMCMRKTKSDASEFEESGVSIYEVLKLISEVARMYHPCHSLHVHR